MAEGAATEPQDFSIQYLENGQLVWSRGRENGQPCGQSCTKFASDGTLRRIQQVLLGALCEIEGQMQLFGPPQNSLLEKYLANG